MFHFLSFECRFETVSAWYKRRPTIETYTTIWYISVLLVSLVYILHICPFPTVFLKICWTFQNRSTVATFWAYKNISKLLGFDGGTNQKHYNCIAGAVVYNIHTLYTRCAPVAVVCIDMYVYPVHCTCDIYHTSSKQSIGWPSMCSTFSLLDVDWKLCLHATIDVQTLKLTQRYGILACCCVIFQLFFWKFGEEIDVAHFGQSNTSSRSVRFWWWNHPKTNCFYHCCSTNIHRRKWNFHLLYTCKRAKVLW